MHFSAFIISISLMAVGCSKRIDAPCRIAEQVYRNGWHTVGEVNVATNSEYSFHVSSNYWMNFPAGGIFTGTVPASVSQLLFADSRSFELTGGVRVIAVGMDDWKTQYPTGVLALLHYLHEKHLPK